MNKLLIITSLMLFQAPDIAPILNPIIEAFNAVLFPVLMGVLTVVAIPTFIGKSLKLMKAEDENQKIAAQKSLMTAIIAFVLVFVVVIGFRLALPILEDWVQSVS